MSNILFNTNVFSAYCNTINTIMHNIVTTTLCNTGGSRIPRRRGRQQSGGHQHTKLPIFPKNCMKLRKFLTAERAPPAPPPPKSANITLSYPKLQPLLRHLYSSVTFSFFFHSISFRTFSYSFRSQSKVRTQLNRLVSPETVISVSTNKQPS